MARLLVALKNNRGQALVESLIAGMALTTAVMAALAVLYFGFVHAGTSYLLHELLVCSSTREEQNCEQKFRQKATGLLFAAQILSLENQRVIGGFRARIVLQLPLKRTLTLKKELRL